MRRRRHFLIVRPDPRPLRCRRRSQNLRQRRTRTRNDEIRLQRHRRGKPRPQTAQPRPIEIILKLRLRPPRTMPLHRHRRRIRTPLPSERNKRRPALLKPPVEPRRIPDEMPDPQRRKLLPRIPGRQPAHRPATLVLPNLPADRLLLRRTQIRRRSSLRNRGIAGRTRRKTQDRTHKKSNGLHAHQIARHGSGGKRDGEPPLTAPVPTTSPHGTQHGKKSTAQ